MLTVKEGSVAATLCTSGEGEEEVFIHSRTHLVHLQLPAIVPLYNLLATSHLNVLHAYDHTICKQYGSRRYEADDGGTYL